jgi:hypothetical protein
VKQPTVGQLRCYSSTAGLILQHHLRTRRAYCNHGTCDSQHYMACMCNAGFTVAAVLNLKSAAYCFLRQHTSQQCTWWVKWVKAALPA